MSDEQEGQLLVHGKVKDGDAMIGVEFPADYLNQTPLLERAAYHAVQSAIRKLAVENGYCPQCGKAHETMPVPGSTATTLFCRACGWKQYIPGEPTN